MFVMKKSGKMAGGNVERELPYLKLDLSVSIDHFKIGAIGCDQAGAVRAGREGYEDVEV